MKKQYLIALSMFSTGVTGVLVGSLIVGKPNFDKAMAVENSKTAPVTERINKSISKTNVADKLSSDFISVSKNVTPAIVTITSTKIVRQRMQYPDMFDDPYFQQFGERGQMEPQRNSKEQSLGSGVIVDEKGLILTNNHVIEGANDIVVNLYDRRKYKAKVVGTDPRSDVAVIKLQGIVKDLPLARLGDSTTLSVGEWVLAIGNPLGLSSTVTSGIISAKGRDHVGITDFEDFIQTDAAINPGNSGGALVNLQGEVIGINTAIASKTGGYMGIGFAIPSNMAKKVMNDLITKGRVVRGYLGIQIQNLDENIAKSLKITDYSKGIIVGDVVQDSPADKAGIQKYDIVIGLDGQDVNDITIFRNTIAAKDPGQTAKITVLRNSKKLELNVKISELKNDSVAKKTQSQQEDQQEFEDNDQ